MPALNETWVRRVGLSNSTATLRGPAQRAQLDTGSALRASARSKIG